MINLPKKISKTREEILDEFEKVHHIENPEDYLATLDGIKDSLDESTELLFLENIGDIMGNSERFNLLFYLSNQSYSVGELKEQLQKAQSTVSHHLKKIEEAGFIQGYKNGKYTNFSLNERAFNDMDIHLNIWLDELDFWPKIFSTKTAS